MSESINPDLDGTTCAVGSCFKVADAMAVATVQLPGEIGLPFMEPPQDVLALEIALCAEHKHLLRMGVTSFDLRT